MLVHMNLKSFKPYDREKTRRHTKKVPKNISFWQDTWIYVIFITTVIIYGTPAVSRYRGADNSNEKGALLDTGVTNLFRLNYP